MNKYNVTFVLNLCTISVMAEGNNEDEAERHALQILENEEGINLNGYRRYDLTIELEGSYV